MGFCLGFGFPLCGVWARGGDIGDDDIDVLYRNVLLLLMADEAKKIKIGQRLWKFIAAGVLFVVRDIGTTMQFTQGPFTGSATN